MILKLILYFKMMKCNCPPPQYRLTDDDFDEQGFPKIPVDYFVVLFKMNGCFYCEQFLPYWNDILKEKNDYFSGYCICFGIVESGKEKVETKTTLEKKRRLLSRMSNFGYSVRGYPTIMFFDLKNRRAIELHRAYKPQEGGEVDMKSTVISEINMCLTRGGNGTGYFMQRQP
jgi:thioredoxin-related protein